MDDKNLLESLEIKGKHFRTKDLNNFGIKQYEINKLISEGILEKIYQGVYRITDTTDIELRDVNIIIENGIISLTSAVFYYNLSSKNDGKITIMLDRDQKPPKVPYEVFSFYYASSKFFELGLNIIDQDGKKIKIYDRERTVCDLIKHRSKFDKIILKEAIETYLQCDECDLEKLYKYARELRVEKTLKEYIELLGGHYGEY